MEFNFDEWIRNIKIFENRNLIAYRDLSNGEIRFEFKPDCDKKVLKMWEQLNTPIR